MIEQMEGRGGVVGEIKRLHIIYFLCSMGSIDHPHLICVHHLTRNGVFLRDIKRWLADLRGKGMPETFTWSYKRRYKKVFLWQDLLDDDLIAPISDNEYVLKGSQMLSHASFDPDPHSYLYAAEKKSCLFKELQPANSKAAAFQMHQNTKTSFEMDQGSPPHHNSGSTLIDACDAMNLQGDQKHSESTIEHNHEQSKDKSSENSCFYSNLLLKKKIKKKSSLGKDKDGKEMGCSTTTSSSSSSSHSSSPQSQSQSVPLGKSKKRHLSMFRNLINCGAVDTDDTVFVRLNRDNKTYSRNKKPPNRSSQDIIICKKKRDKSDGGSAGLFRTCMNQHHQTRQPQKHTTASKSDDKNQKTASSANRPIGGPHCSHCRKQFKPEKLHSHMKSCIGMKALSKTASASVVKMP